MNIRAIVTDIEGTTSSIAFVHEVLFPYASERLPDYIRQYCDSPEVARLLDAVRDEAGAPDSGIEIVIETLLAWIAEDRKVTPLKTLQGLVWQHGYERGDFTGHIFDDAVTEMREWAKAGIDLYVYSSGSVGAQKLLFHYSDAGDLRSLFQGYFDTEVGPKRQSESYRNIISSIEVEPARILFLSDVAEELDAAREAGMQTTQLVRDDDVVRGDHRVARDFTEVVIN